MVWNVVVTAPVAVNEVNPESVVASAPTVNLTTGPVPTERIPLLALSKIALSNVEVMSAPEMVPLIPAKDVIATPLAFAKAPACPPVIVSVAPAIPEMSRIRLFVRPDDASNEIGCEVPFDWSVSNVVEIPAPTL